MQIVTGYRGESHITANDEQGKNQGIFGTSSYVLNVGNKFSPTAVTANEIQIADGEAVMQGVHFRVDPGTYDTVTIDNGTQGMKRKDLIVARYTKNSLTGIEDVAWTVIKGTPAASNPTRPSATSGDILNGTTVADMAFYEVVLDGINLDAINPLFSTLVPQATLLSRLATAESGISQLNSKITNYVGLLSYTLENLTVPANSYTSFTHTVEREGYTPLGVSGYQISGSSACWLLECRITQAGVINLRVKNDSNVDVTLTGVTVYVLWKAS